MDLREGIVELVDLRNFKVLHTWNPDIDEFNDLVEQVDEFKFLERDSNNNRFMLIHPAITGKGELIFVRVIFAPFKSFNNNSIWICTKFSGNSSFWYK